MLGSQHKTTRISRIKTGEYHNQMNQLTLDENSGKGTKRLRRMKRRNGKTKVEKNNIHMNICTQNYNFLDPSKLICLIVQYTCLQKL